MRWAFGHGLSYTQFEYSNLRVNKEKIAQGEGVHVAIDVKNVGHMGAKEVVQLYVHSAHDGAARPEQELKGFEKVYIAPGKTETVEFELNPRAFAYYEGADSRLVRRGRRV